MHEFNNVTITTDISLNQQRHKAAYAFWISTELGPIKKSGMLKGKHTSVPLAELMCIANAVHFFVKTGLKTKKLIINTDSQGGQTLLIKNGKEGRNKRVDVIARLINETVLGKYEQVVFRHVKAHNGTRNKRSYVNDWCDRESRRVLKKHLHNKNDTRSDQPSISR